MNAKSELAKPYAAQLDEVEFENEELYRGVLIAADKLKNAYRAGGFWVVKLMIDGEQVTVGRTRSVLKAARFADMAIAKFKCYRSRGKHRELTDLDVNISIENARHDLDTNTYAANLLGRMESLWKAHGLLPEAAQLPTVEFKVAISKLLRQIDEACVALRHSGIPASLVECFLATAKEMKTNATSSLKHFLEHQPEGKQSRAARRSRGELFVQGIKANVEQEEAQTAAALEERKQDQEQRQQQIEQMGGTTEKDTWADLSATVNPKAIIK